MKYGVFWSAEAENQLAAIWLSAPNQQAVTAAADEIDFVLA